MNRTKTPPASNEVSDDPVRAARVRIERAMRDLVVPAEKEAYLLVAAQGLARLANRPASPSSEPFRDVGKRRTREELQRIAGADPPELPDVLAEIHASTIAELASSGAMRSDLPRRVIAAACRALTRERTPADQELSAKLASINIRNQDSSTAGHWACLTEHEYGLPPNSLRTCQRPPAWKPASAGRPCDGLACGVALIVLHHFEFLTGEPGTQGSPDGLQHLLRETFSALHVTANHRAALAKAQAELSKRRSS